MVKVNQMSMSNSSQPSNCLTYHLFIPPTTYILYCFDITKNHPIYILRLQGLSTFLLTGYSTRESKKKVSPKHNFFNDIICQSYYHHHYQHIKPEPATWNHKHVFAWPDNMQSGVWTRSHPFLSTKHGRYLWIKDQSCQSRTVWLETCKARANKQVQQTWKLFPEWMKCTFYFMEGAWWFSENNILIVKYSFSIFPHEKPEIK